MTIISEKHREGNGIRAAQGSEDTHVIVHVAEEPPRTAKSVAGTKRLIEWALAMKSRTTLDYAS
jgi:hypothetical protein